MKRIEVGSIESNDLRISYSGEGPSEFIDLGGTDVDDCARAQWEDLVRAHQLPGSGLQVLYVHANTWVMRARALQLLDLLREANGNV